MNDGMTLRELREQSGKTRTDVAAALGVTVSAVFKYESGTRFIDIQQVKILKEFYGVSAEEVIDCQLNSCRYVQ